MTLPEAPGCLASGLVLLTFGMRTMLPMRIAAIGSNLAFIAYGLALDLSPIWVLHGILLPLNTIDWSNCCNARGVRGDAAGGERSLEWRELRVTGRSARSCRLGEIWQESFRVLSDRGRRP